FAPIGRDDVVEIVYTSGTTGEPKGVVHRHRNIVANLKPFKTEIDKYKKWARPFQPIRILNLLPLSHMLPGSWFVRPVGTRRFCRLYGRTEPGRDHQYDSTPTHFGSRWRAPGS